MRRNSQPPIVKKNMAARSTMPAKRRFRHRAALSQRMRGVEKSECTQFAPPENWYEPTDEGSIDYEIVVQSPGRGFRHVVTPEEIQQRLQMDARRKRQPCQPEHCAATNGNAFACSDSGGWPPT